MHGLAHSNNVTRILALDLGKFTSVLCVYDPATHVHHFESVQTTPGAVHDLLVARQTQDPSHTLLVIETCDVAGWVHDVAAALGIRVAVANPAHEAWRWTRVKLKTDKDDALKLARLTVLGQLPAAHMPSPQQRQRRRLVHYRRVLVDRRTQVKNQVRSIFSQQGMQLPPRGKAWTKIGVAQIARHARPVGDCTDADDLWRGRLHLELQQVESLSRQIAIRSTPGSTHSAPRTTACDCCKASPASGRGSRRPSSPTSTARAASRRAARSPATPGWSPSRSRAAR